MLLIALRGTLLLLLLLAFFLPSVGDQPPPPGSVIELPTFASSGEREASFPESLFLGEPPKLLVRRSTSPPTARELNALAALATRSPLIAALPASTPQLELEAPAAPRAERATILRFAAMGLESDSLRVRLSDGTGVLDSVQVAVSGGGMAGALRIRPARPGWQEWTIQAGGRRATTGAWVAPAAAPRVLVAAGPPNWESRWVTRALEGSGAELTVAQPLGRGLALDAERRELPTSPTALDEYDAIVVLGGTNPTPAQRAALDEYAARGGGVMWVGGGEGGGGEIAADRIHWSLPPELVSLPPASLRTAVAPLPDLPVSAQVAAAGDDQPLLALQPYGRGRIARLAISESWRWPMEAGASAEHREFWRSLAEWLSATRTEPFALELSESLGSVGEPVTIQIFSADPVQEDREDALAVPALLLTPPDGAVEPLPATPDPERPGVWRAAFVPAMRGVYELRLEGMEARAGFRAAAGPLPARDPWARLALLAAESDGAALPPDSLDPVLRRWAAETPTGSFPWRVALFGTVLLVAAADWGIRRLTNHV